MAKKKNRPSSIFIKGTPFDIIYEDVVTDGDEKEELYGLTDVQALWIKISLSKNTTEELLQKTLFHEVIHATLGMGGQGDTIGDEKIEEGIVVCLENGLWQLMDFRKGIL